MQHEDYIMRFIRQFAAFLAQVLGIAAVGKYREAHAEIEQKLKELSGLDSDSLLRLDEGGLITTLRLYAPSAWQETGAATAALLDQQASFYAAQNQPDASYAHRLKALHLLLELLTADERFEPPGYAPDVEEIRTELETYVLPFRTYATLLRYYEQEGDYAEAEDVLFQWIDSDPDSPMPVEQGIAFYRRLLARDDADLEAGNLPRAEVEAGLAELTAGDS